MACLHPIIKNGRTIYRLVVCKGEKKYFTKIFRSFQEGERFLKSNPQYGTLRSWNKESSKGVKAKIGANKKKFFTFTIGHEIKGNFNCCFSDFQTAVRFRDLVWDKYKYDPGYLRKDLRVDSVYFKFNGCLLNIENSSENEFLKMQIEILLDRIKELESS